MKLPKILIDYSKPGYPLDGSTVLIHCDEVQSYCHDSCAAIVEAHFELDGEYSDWVAHSNPDLGVAPRYYTPMPEFEVKGDA